MLRALPIFRDIWMLRARAEHSSRDAKTASRLSVRREFTRRSHTASTYLEARR